MNNVVILKRVQAYNIDALNRTAKCESDLQNGSVFQLLTQSEEDGEKMVWEATAPTASTDTGLWMATSPEVVITRDAMGNEYKGLNQDPRAFVNLSGRMIDSTKLMEGDLIEMTGAGITDIATTANKYLVPESGSFVLKATSTAGTGFCLEKIGTGKMSIGTGSLIKEPVTSYKFVCKKN